MKDQKNAERFRRFETSELILHWVNAIPFIILLITGGLMIYSRFSDMSADTLELLTDIHKIFAVVWTALMGISFFTVGTKLNLSNLREFFRMGNDDIKWLIIAVRSIYDHKIEIPPAGKFNTGQKINSLLVLFYAMAFPVSGAIMWFYGTILLAWYFHAAIFFMAATSVAGHLYLSFINPSTRVGLWGIFHGWVPKSYIAHHHSLTLGYKRETAVEDFDPEKRKKDPNETKLSSSSFMSAEIVIIILTLVLGIVGFGIFKKGATLGTEFNAIIRPNQLSKAHQIKELNTCTACHEYTGELKDEKCMDCHKLVKQRKEAKLGYHGTNEGKCIKCHREHPAEALGKIIKFEKEEFDHNEALFKLAGKHAEIKECEECHKERPKGASEGLYIGMKFELCTDCHKDPHNNELGAKCETCHTDAGWKGKDLKFDHNKDSKYRLEGKHASIKCVDCHKPKTADAALGTAQFRNMKYELCTDCHKDPHNNELGSKCEQCHNYSSWKGKDLKFDHNKDSKYRLEGKHDSTKCVDCHKPRPANAELGTAQFRKMKYKLCADCHKDPHKNELGSKCETCHNYRSWKGKDVRFDHNKDSKYKLEGKHESIKCVECHKPRPANAALGTAQFKNMKFKLCTDCHEDPHKGQFKDKTCTPCHTIKSWREKDLNFDHNKDSKFKLLDKHKELGCADCHVPDQKDANAVLKKLTKLPKKKTGEKPKKDIKFGTAQLAGIKFKLCTDCHEDPHKGQFKDKTCTPCHTIKSWREKDLNFDHNKDSKYKLVEKHKEIACTDCHIPDEKNANTAIKKLTQFPKKKTDEKPKKDIRFGTAQLKDIQFKLCTDCHEDPHKNVFGSSCDYCHNYTNWKKKKAK